MRRAGALVWLFGVVVLSGIGSFLMRSYAEPGPIEGAVDALHRSASLVLVVAVALHGLDAVRTRTPPRHFVMGAGALVLLGAAAASGSAFGGPRTATSSLLEVFHLGYATLLVLALIVVHLPSSRPRVWSWTPALQAIGICAAAWATEAAAGGRWGFGSADLFSGRSAPAALWGPLFALALLGAFAWQRRRPTVAEEAPP